jgi:hypothetical protein
MVLPLAVDSSTSIREQVLRELVQAAAQVSATVMGQEKGFAVIVRLGNIEKTLATSRNSVRLFASLDTAGTFIRDLGIPQFEVDMTKHQPGRLRKPRPDRAEALRLTRTKMRQQPLGFGNVKGE